MIWWDLPSDILHNDPGGLAVSYLRNMKLVSQLPFTFIQNTFLFLAIYSKSCGSTTKGALGNGRGCIGLPEEVPRKRINHICKTTIY
jgi:hypothetical protein